MAATFLAEEGVEAAGEGRFEDAASAFERSLDLEDCALTRCNLGVAYERLGRTADAIEAYTAAAALAPEDPVALVNRGDALVRAGRLDDATRAYVAAPCRVELKSSTRLRCDRFDAPCSDLRRELDESHRFVPKSAESTSM